MAKKTTAVPAAPTTTPVDSANLILRLYEERREKKLRKARDFMLGFDPQTAEEYVAAFMGPNGVHIRMVTSYWEMAATLVAHGAIDPQMFQEASGEYLLVFSRLRPILPQLREAMGVPTYLQNLEKVCMAAPGAADRLDAMRERIRAMLAKRPGRQAPQRVAAALA